jgi:uncharacterized RDD family membrane protein YckC
MRNIDFRTSHNIVLSYPLASPYQRVMAYFIDIVIVYILFVLTLFIVGENEITKLILSTIYFFLYHLLFEIFAMGQSLGKKILKIRVVGLDGKTPSLKQYIVRWSFRLIDVGLTLGSLGFFAIYSSPLGQRIGDLLAGTTVVSTTHILYNNLSELEKLNKTKRDTKYAAVVQYTDEEMITVKKMLQRYKSNPNDDNGDLIVDLSQKIAKDLNIPNIKGSRVEFLENVLSDYIILTR